MQRAQGGDLRTAITSSVHQTHNMSSKYFLRRVTTAHSILQVPCEITETTPSPGGESHSPPPAHLETRTGNACANIITISKTLLPGTPKTGIRTYSGGGADRLSCRLAHMCVHTSRPPSFPFTARNQTPTLCKLEASAASCGHQGTS